MIALALMLLLLVFQFRSIVQPLLIFVAIPFSFFGVFTALNFTGNPISFFVAVGFIALAGLAAETGIVMLAYLDEAYHRRKRENRLKTLTDLYDGIIEGAVLRVRPKLMTVATTILALLPVMTSQGRGSDVMVPMAIPSFGGMTVVLLTVFVVPTLYCWLEERKVGRAAGQEVRA